MCFGGDNVVIQPPPPPPPAPTFAPPSFEFTPPEPDPFTQQLQQLELDRLQGNLPVPEALRQGLQAQRRTLNATLLRALGPGYEVSTPGIQKLAAFQQSAAALRDAARHGNPADASLLASSLTAAMRGTQAQEEAMLQAQVGAESANRTAALDAYQAQNQANLEAYRLGTQAQIASAQARGAGFGNLATLGGVGLGLWGLKGFPGIGVLGRSFGLTGSGGGATGTGGGYVPDVGGYNLGVSSGGVPLSYSGYGQGGPVSYTPTVPDFGYTWNATPGLSYNWDAGGYGAGAGAGGASWDPGAGWASPAMPDLYSSVGSDWAGSVDWASLVDPAIY